MSRAALQHAPDAPDKASAATSPRIGPAHDNFEQEADQAAERVASGEYRHVAWSLSRVALGAVQRECSCCGACDDCKKKKELLQRHASSSAVVDSHAPASVASTLSRPGSELDPGTRSFMESRFGHDFSGVRIHSDEQAAASAHDVSANAYTVGSAIVFNQGQYQPHTPSGKKLLAHELVHVVQQDGNAPSLRVSEPDEPVEQEANRVAEQVSGGQTLLSRPRPRAQSPAIMRQNVAVIKPGSPGFREARGTSGEQGMAFSGYPAEEGWVFLQGPSGSAGHAWNQPGFDGVAFKAKGGFEMHIIDNKSFARPANISSSSALTRNLLNNLDEVIQAAADTSLDGLDGISAARAALANARAAVAAGRSMPANVKLIVTNFGGRSPGITASLRAKGIIFRDLMTSPRTAASSGTPTASTTGSGGGTAATATKPATTGQTGASQASEANVSPAPTQEGAVEGAVRGTTDEGALGRSAGDVVGKAGEVPDVTLPETGGGAATVEETAATGGAAEVSIAGIAVGIVVELAIGIAIGLVINWLKGKIEQGFLERDIRKLSPQIQARLRALGPKIVELQKKGKVYSRITFDIVREATISTPPEAQGFPIVTDDYKGVTLADVDVTGEDQGNSQVEKDVPGMRTIYSTATEEHYLETVSTLLDDPQKRKRAKETAEAKEKLRREAALHPAPPPPPTTQSTPLLPLPAPQQPSSDFDPLGVGKFGGSPNRDAEAVVAKFKQMALDLIAEGNKLLSSSPSPSRPEIDAYLHRVDIWRAAATIAKNFFVDHGPGVGASGMDEAINSDQYGGRLKEISQTFGG
jgi:hypothetical protein